MTPMETLTKWHESWRIKGGVISCKSCQAEQLECDRANAFAHAPNCVKTTLGINPWQELDDVQKAFSSGKS